MSQKKKQVELPQPFFSIEKPYLKVGRKRIHGYYLILISIVFVFASAVSIRGMENSRIRKEGKLVRAMVVDVKYVGARGKKLLTFRYAVSDKVYKATQKSEPYEVGDSVYLLYLEKSPETMRTYRFLMGKHSPYEKDVTE